MASYEEIEALVLQRIKPSKELEERGLETYRFVKARVEEVAKREGWSCEVSLEGSFAKGTWLATSPELDVFVLLKGASKEDVKAKVFPRLREAFSDLKPKTAFSEHPYLSLEVNGFKVEVVPALCGGPYRTAVDRTPLHTRYVLSKVDDKLRDEIRLLKQFAKGVGVYGAEIAVEGFSGYLLELLVIAYGGFREVLKAASQWRPPVVIDLEGAYANPSDALRALGEKPLVVVDPVDPKRNVASAVSLEKLGEFVMASRLYLERPSIYYFFPPEPSEEERARALALLEPLLEKVVVVHVKLPKPLPPDTIWGEVKRAARNVKSLLEREGFGVVRCSAWASEEGEALVACMLEDSLKPAEAKQLGPPISSLKHSMNFVAKYAARPGSGPWVEGWRLCALKERAYVSAVALLEERSEEFLVSDLREGSFRVFLLSWAPEDLGAEARRWLEDFVVGKPKWLLPYCASLEKG